MAETPFDNQILWVYWKGTSVVQSTITELATTLKAQTPVVSGVLIKSNHGDDWQGRWDTKEEMAVNGPDDIKEWVEELDKQGLETHLWTVIRGDDIDAEVEKLAQACMVPGVKSMLLDIEAGDLYFGGKTAEDAREIITKLRAAIPEDFHLGLNFDYRGRHPQSIHIDEWIPHVQSLHPMVYHWHFSEGTRTPEVYLDAAFTKLGAYDLPIVPMLQTYPDPSSGLQVPDYQILDAGNYSLEQGAAGITLFRYGTFITEKEAAAINQIQLKDNPHVQEQETLQTVTADMAQYQIVTLALSVRSEPTTAGSKTGSLLAGETIEVDPESATEADGYVWLQHLTGWSAEKKIDNSEVYMTRIVTTEEAKQKEAEETETETEPQPEPEPEFLEMRVVSGIPLRVRSQPMGTPLDPPLNDGTIIIVDANSRTEKGGFIWWKHERGWSAETDVQGLHGINLELVTKTDDTGTVVPINTETKEFTSSNTKKFQVVYPHPIWIRTQPLNDRSLVIEEKLPFGTIIDVDADSRKVSGGLVFWQHDKGWSVEKKEDGSEIYMMEATKETGSGAGAGSGEFMFDTLPLRWDDFTWFQYYGNTVFAFTNGKKWGYDKYAQGLHAGIDLGSSEKVPVFAGVSGTLGYAGNRRAYSPGRVDIHVGDWLIIYGHVIEWTTQPEGTPVKPDTIIGYLHGKQNSHLHLEIRHQPTGTIHNPLTFFEKAITDRIIRNHPATGWRRFYSSDFWNLWQEPFDQPIIKLGGPVIGPTANR